MQTESSVCLSPSWGHHILAVLSLPKWVLKSEKKFFAFLGLLTSPKAFQFYNDVLALCDGQPSKTWTDGIELLRQRSAVTGAEFKFLAVFTKKEDALTTRLACQGIFKNPRLSEATSRSGCTPSFSKRSSRPCPWVLAL